MFNSNLIKTFKVNNLEYEYNFNRMQISRILHAEQLFVLDAEFYKKESLPGSDEQFIKGIQRKLPQKALATILMKKTQNGYEDFEPENETNILDLLTGKDYGALQEVKADFFSLSLILQKLLTEQSLTLIEKSTQNLNEEQLKSVLKEMRSVNIVE